MDMLDLSGIMAGAMQVTAMATQVAGDTHTITAGAVLILVMHITAGATHIMAGALVLATLTMAITA